MKRFRIGWFCKHQVVRHLSALLIATAIFIPATGSASDHNKALSDQQRKGVEVLIQKYIMENPQVILRSITALQVKETQAKEQRAQQTLSQRNKELFNDGKSFVGGNPNGDITLVEFFDYQCGYCKKVHPTVTKLLKEDGNIRFVYKEFPILGPASTYAAKATIASIAQGKYLTFHNALMEVKGALSEQRVLQIAKSVGLNTKKLLSAMTSQGDAADRVMDLNYSLAKDLEINGTPAFIIGNEIIRGAVGMAALKEVVAEARAAKKSKGG